MKCGRLLYSIVQSLEVYYREHLEKNPIQTLFPHHFSLAFVNFNLVCNAEYI